MYNFVSRNKLEYENRSNCPLEFTNVIPWNDLRAFMIKLATIYPQKRPSGIPVQTHIFIQHKLSQFICNKVGNGSEL